MPWQAVRERNEGTGELRVRCEADDCGWLSPTFGPDEDWKADLAAQSHAESVHGTTIGWEPR